MQEQLINTTFEIAALVVVRGVSKPLYYRLGPEQLETPVGSEVLVQLGKTQTSGYLIEKLPLSEAIKIFKTEKPLKNSSQIGLFSEDEVLIKLKSVLDVYPGFLPEQLPLFKWIADYYGCSLIEVIENAVPKRSSPKNILYATLIENDEQILNSISKSARLQKLILAHLKDRGSTSVNEILKLGSSARAAIKSLKRKKIIKLSKQPPKRLTLESANNKDPAFIYTKPDNLTPGQEKARKELFSALEKNAFSSYLLYGVTGSGKTEVYLQAIEKVLEEGGSALIVVPEIALTPQFIDQFQTRLKTPIALLHSQVGIASRWRAWEDIYSGKIRVAIGARSAVFAPLKNLRLIVVDEEHESSYKQSDGLRYNARDVAVMRAKFSNAVIVLGSATPSFESLVNVERKRYSLLELPERASTRPLPELEIIDLNQIKRKEMPSENISPRLHEEIKKTLDQKGQVVILYNKRGFASFLQCESCHEVFRCPHCSVTLTLHKKNRKLLCHYCDYALTTPENCPNCVNPGLVQIETDDEGNLLAKKSVVKKLGKLVERGSGTEKVVDELRELFPGASILRMDRDTVRGKDSYRHILGSMRSGQADILVGTQMIAKGHDLPGVTLVGIVSADVGLHLPDFRSSEKIFQLITQAAGRAGRGTEPGRVLVQTREPQHPTILATKTGRFLAFARYELEYRKQLKYPPTKKLLRLIISCPSAQDTFQGAIITKQAVSKIIEQIKESSTNAECLIAGPAPAPIEKISGRYRWHMLIKSSSSTILSQIASTLYQWRSSVELKDFRLAIDIDPVDML